MRLLLDEWADRMAGWLKEEATIFAFCHCPDETYSPQICRELHQRVAARVKIDPLPWDEAGRQRLPTRKPRCLITNDTNARRAFVHRVFVDRFTSTQLRAERCPPAHAALRS